MSAAFGDAFAAGAQATRTADGAAERCARDLREWAREHDVSMPELVEMLERVVSKLSEEE